MKFPNLIVRPQISAPAFATWSSILKSTGITLSGGNLIATVNTASPDNHMVGGTAAINGSDKAYWETLITVNPGPDFGGVGIAAIGADYTAGAWHGFNADTIGIYPDGNAYCNFNGVGAPISGGFAPYSGVPTNVQLALDRSLTKIWQRLAGGAWFPSGDPALGTGGFDYSPFLGGVDVVPGATLYQPNGSATVNFGASAFANAPPAGFSGV
jgi:hypothetical protein